jgi:D-3-phosphoglycerate dehydrogenase
MNRILRNKYALNALARANKSPTMAVNLYHSSANKLARVLATDQVDESCIKIFQERGHQVDFLDTMTEAELIKIIGDYDGLVVRSATKVTPAVIKHAIKMRVIGRAGVGIDNINVKEATQRGIMVMNTPGGNTISTAQLALSLMASLARKLPQADAVVKSGKWNKKNLMGVELQGKTIGIVGCGRIGQVVASGAQAIGMTVIGYDPVMSSEGFAEVGITQGSLDDIWAKCDFITFHTPLTPDTKDLLNDATIAKCKKGVQVINCARGGIINEAALLRGLESGHVGGAALDVFSTEPPSKDPSLAALLAHPNLICTPHLGASTDEAQLNVAKDIAVQMSDAFDEQQGISAADYYFSVVNAGYLASSTLPNMPPFLELAETIGNMLAQIVTATGPQASIKSMTLKTYGGRDVNITTKTAKQLLEAAVLKGMLKPYIRHLARSPSPPMDPDVLGQLTPDLISSPSIAKDLNIQANVSIELPSLLKTSITRTTYWNLVSVTVGMTDGTETNITGTVFGSIPHIVRLDNSEVTLKTEGNYMLTFKNEDRPGAISEVLSLLSREQLNVASLVLSKTGQVDSLARCFISLDDEPSERALESLKGLSSLTSVAKIQLR